MAEEGVLADDTVTTLTTTDPSSPTADEIIAGGESKNNASTGGESAPVEQQDNSTVNNTPKTLESNLQEGENKPTPPCKDDEDNKLKQNESGTLLSRGGEFEAEPNQTDNLLNDIQTTSDIRFFICGSCKYNPILIGSVPKLLPCLHSFCENCLQDRYDKQKEATEGGNAENVPRLKCPSCGQEFLVAGNDKPTASFLNNQFVIESTPSKGMDDKQEDHQCTSCDDKSTANSYCLNCNEWLCDTCVSAHQRVKVTKDHIIQARSTQDGISLNNELPTVDTQPIDAKRKPLLCKVHPQEQLKLFCANCEKLTCRDCQLIEHKDHRYQFIDEAASKHREILKKLLQYLQINLGLLKETINDVEKVSDGLSFQEKDLEDQVNKAFNGLINAIKGRQEALVKELKNLVLSKQMLLSKQKKDLTQMKVILEHNHDFAEFAVKGGSNVALLYSRKVLGTRLHNLNSLKYRQRPLACLDLKFSMDVEKLRNYFIKVGTVYSHEDMQRKIDHYNTKSANSNTPRTIALTSRLMQNKNISSKQNPIESITAINKRISEQPVSSSSTPTQYINLSKQGSLGLPGHLMVRSAASTSTYNNSNFHQRNTASTTSSNQEMIVLSSSHTGRSPTIVTKDGKMITNNSRYAHYPGQREPSRSSPKTPYDNNKTFQFHHQGPQSNREYSRSSSVSSPMTEPSIHWPKVTGEHLSAPKNVSTMDQLRRMVEGGSVSSHNKNLNENNSGIERSASARSNGSDGSAHSGQLSLNGIVVKQEGHSPDSSTLNFPALQQQQQVKTKRINSTSSLQYNGKSSGSHDDMRSESGFDEGQNEDYCGVCRNGGELLCCDTCPKVYHLHCHIPPLNNLPSDSWSCHLCLDIGTETNNSIGSKRKYSDGLTAWELKLCQKLLLNLFVHTDSLPFQHKVSKVQVPDYYKVINRPMDLNTVMTKLAPQHFEHHQSLEEFIVDIRLIFSNCFVYNSAESEVCKMGRRLESFFDGLLRKFVPCENHYPNTDGKVKRTRKEDCGVFN